MRSKIREILNQIKWKYAFDEKGMVYYVSREEGKVKILSISLRRITDIREHYFRVGEKENAKYIPYHRVVKIEHMGHTVWLSKRWFENAERRDL
jgi:uncharacterized protein (UPF0248 family)